MNINRFRVWLAQLLLRRTGCEVARSSELTEVITTAEQLINYVETSGGLLEPRRIRAHRRILGFAGKLEERTRRIRIAA